MKLSETAALIIIDVQKGFDLPIWGTRNNHDAEDHIARLLKGWRETGRPVFHVQHMSTSESSPLHPARDGNQIKDLVQPLPGEPLIQKTVNSSFIGTNLESLLRQSQCETLVIAGLTTNHCVETTTRMAGNLGFNTFLVSDATATFNRIGLDGRNYTADEIHAMSLSNINGEFATIVCTDELLERLL